MSHRTRARRADRCRIGVLTIAVLTAGAWAEDRPVPPMPTYLLGIVTEADGITPSPRLTILVHRAGAAAGTSSYFAHTDDNGAFVTTEPLPPGDYELGTFGGTNNSTLQTITMAADSGPVGVRLVRPAGSISGLVTDPAGQPAIGARVTLLDPTKKSSYNIEVDANGAYTIDHVLAGTYDVLASRMPNGPGGPLETVTLPKQNIGTVNVNLDIHLAPLKPRKKPAAAPAPAAPAPAPATQP